jgi:RecB family exonuclease
VKISPDHVDRMVHPSGEVHLLPVEYKTGEAPPFHPHVGFQRQLATYQLVLREASGMPCDRGLVLYARKLGKGYSDRPVMLEDNRERVEQFMLDVVSSVPVFENSSSTMEAYRDLVRDEGRCVSKNHRCFLYDYCHTDGGLQKAISVLQGKAKV